MSEFYHDQADPWPSYSELFPEEEDSSEALIADGSYRFLQAATNKLEQHTGRKGEFFTAEEEYLVALDLIAGREARERIEKEGTVPDEVTREVIEKGNIARNKLIETNLRFAASYARRSMGLPASKKQSATFASTDGMPGITTFGDITHLADASVPLDDRMQMANIGLIKAADTFVIQPNKKTGKPIRFQTWAAWRIHNEIYQSIQSTEFKGIYLPMNIYNYVNQPDELHDDQSAEATARRALLRQMQTTTYLEDIDLRGDNFDEIDDDETEPQPFRLDEILPADRETYEPEHRFAKKHTTEKLISALESKFGERSIAVIVGRFGLAGVPVHTFDELADMFKVSRERIRQIEQDTLESLRAPRTSAQFSEEFRLVIENNARYNPHELGRFNEAMPNIKTNTIDKI